MIPVRHFGDLHREEIQTDERRIVSRVADLSRGLIEGNRKLCCQLVRACDDASRQGRIDISEADAVNKNGFADLGRPEGIRKVGDEVGISDVEIGRADSGFQILFAVDEK